MRTRATIVFYSMIWLLFSFCLVNAQSENENVPELQSNEEIREQFGSWLQVCLKDSDQCVGVQFALNVSGDRSARFVLEKVPDSSNEENSPEAVITVFIPFESAIPVLPNGLGFTVDANESFREQFVFCDQLGCTSQFGIKIKIYSC